MARRHVWLGALRHLALVDGHHLSPAEQQQQLEEHPARRCCPRAVIVALADGYLSEPEVELLRHGLEAIELGEPAVARLLVKLIPAQCPFKRDAVVFGRKLAHIPPMCSINPLDDQLMGLRFRCLGFLEGGEPPAQADPAAGNGAAGSPLHQKI